ncbi:hypothetical protein NQ314_017126 [Rhamnusium bicolor]|uniref:Uncharacterized protein n=1 Tax=Rhamnusium bicolor TaxID=1586634 RepID=A0AAV8WU73_9CUCU|nr:hypothetical protein NQ314_017126 [Rhamnusium bicolor]
MEEMVASVVCLEKNIEGRVWVHEINLKRKREGEYHTLMDILEKEEHSDRFHMYFRMKKEYLHNLLKVRIKKIDTRFRQAISTKERLAICLR